jgi:hypothetical protein
MTNSRRIRTPPAPAAHILRHLALERLSESDWRCQLAGWWIVCAREPHQQEMRPVLVVPPCWLVAATRYAYVDAGSVPLDVDNIAVRLAPQRVYDALMAYLREQCAIDDFLLQVTAAG